MVVQELLDEIKRLPIDDQLDMLEALSHNIREVLHRQMPMDSLRGLLKSDQPAPTDEVLKSHYIDYLADKYQ